VQLTRIVETTAISFSYSVEELVSPSRRDALVHARQVGMYVARSLGFAYQLVAQGFGRKDHTTVVHAVRRVKADALMLSEADQLLAYLRTGT
jgi:chromosomal replication initiator protein